MTTSNVITAITSLILSQQLMITKVGANYSISARRAGSTPAQRFIDRCVGGQLYKQKGQYYEDRTNTNRTGAGARARKLAKRLNEMADYLDILKKVKPRR